jgi:replication factor C subunit 3/5
MALWIDTHRPSRLSDLTVHPQANDLLSRISATFSFPHLLFCGPPGSGKKTRVMAFLRQLFHADIETTRMRTEYRTIEIGDGSSNKKIEVQLTSSPHHVELTPADAGNNDRHVIAFFLKEIAASQTIGDVPIKVVVVNEAHRLSRLAQQALRRTMEKYARTCRLILICDSLSQIIEPVRSRCLIVRTPRVAAEDISAIVTDVAGRERLDIPEDHVRQLVEEAHGNIRRALTLLEMYAMKKKAGAPAGPTVPEWERYTDSLCRLVKESKLDGTVMKAIRNHLYELLVHCVPPTEIFKRLVHVLLQGLDPSLIEPVTEAAAAYEARMQNGTKPIFHLEAFVAKFVCIYRDFFAEMAGEF